MATMSASSGGVAAGSIQLAFETDCLGVRHDQVSDCRCTNIYPDHLNRYADMDEYIHDKKAIFLYQKAADFCIFNGDQAQTVELAEEAPVGKSFFRTLRTCRQLGIFVFLEGTTEKMSPRPHTLLERWGSRSGSFVQR